MEGETVIMKVYLAGGMTGLSFKEQNKWREDFKKEFYFKNARIINPCDYYNLNQPYDTEKEIFEYDLNHIRTSDLIIVNFNNPKSIGTAMELMLAKELHIPILACLPQGDEVIHPWLLECCMKTFKNMDELTSYVEKYYFY